MARQGTPAAAAACQGSGRTAAGRSSERTCAPGHAAAGPGHRSVEDLLANILDPNMAMNPAYVTYAATLADGEEEAGVLAAETPQSVTLLQAGGCRGGGAAREAEGAAVQRPFADARGPRAGVTPQEMRDLIALLQARP
jgi:putative heme-binding domain-containing protein